MEADENEEDQEDQEDYSDDDDVSWKIRRAASKCLDAVINTRHELLYVFYSEVSPILISRFKGRLSLFRHVYRKNPRLYGWVWGFNLCVFEFGFWFWELANQLKIFKRMIYYTNKFISFWVKILVSIFIFLRF